MSSDLSFWVGSTFHLLMSGFAVTREFIDMLFEAFTEPGSRLQIGAVPFYIGTAGITRTPTNQAACFNLFMGRFAVT